MSIYMHLVNPGYQPDAQLKRDIQDEIVDLEPSDTEPAGGPGITCLEAKSDRKFHSDCDEASAYDLDELSAQATVDTDMIKGSYEVGRHGDCSLEFTPNPGVVCYWLKTDLKSYATDLVSACQGPGNYLIDSEEDVGRRCSGVLKAKRTGQSPKTYILGDSVYSYDAKKSGWMGSHKWLSFEEHKDPRTDDNVKLTWCSASNSLAAQGTDLPGTYKLGEWPTGSVGEVSPFPNSHCEYKNKDGTSYNDASPGPEVVSLDCGHSPGRGKCVKYNNKDIWPGYYQCDSLDAGKKHMQFIYAMCEF